MTLGKWNYQNRQEPKKSPAQATASAANHDTQAVILVKGLANPFLPQYENRQTLLSPLSPAAAKTDAPINLSRKQTWPLLHATAYRKPSELRMIHQSSGLRKIIPLVIFYRL
jgi:hypothetical protein